MHVARFEPTTSALERGNTVHASDRTSAAIGSLELIPINPKMNLGKKVNVKVKLSLCLTKHYATKVYGGVDV
jgi:hypothetical protein